MSGKNVKLTKTTIFESIGYIQGMSSTGVTKTDMLLNLTPHPITIVIGADDQTITIPAMGATVRVSTVSGREIGNMMYEGFDIPLFGSSQAGEVILINRDGSEQPFSSIPQNPEVTYIVSGIAGTALKHRTDILVPMTAPSDKPVRNEKGWIVAVRGLKRA